MGDVVVVGKGKKGKGRGAEGKRAAVRGEGEVGECAAGAAERDRASLQPTATDDNKLGPNSWGEARARLQHVTVMQGVL